jgi:hypothetical protein
MTKRGLDSRARLDHRQRGIAMIDAKDWSIETDCPRLIVEG